MMHNFKESKTYQNLENAFAGESMANRRYLFFAKKARELGNEEMAKLFEDTAAQETAHAFAHLELVLAGEKLTVKRLLEIAEEGERYENQQMYPDFEKIALKEGAIESAKEFQEQAAESLTHAEIFKKAAKRFGALKKVEGIHADRYHRAGVKVG